MSLGPDALGRWTTKSRHVSERKVLQESQGGRDESFYFANKEKKTVVLCLGWRDTLTWMAMRDGVVVGCEDSGARCEEAPTFVKYVLGDVPLDLASGPAAEPGWLRSACGAILDTGRPGSGQVCWSILG